MGKIYPTVQDIRTTSAKCNIQLLSGVDQITYGKEKNATLRSVELNQFISNAIDVNLNKFINQIKQLTRINHYFDLNLVIFHAYLQTRLHE